MIVPVRIFLKIYFSLRFPCDLEETEVSVNNKDKP
jgi:hypothetical protein